MLYSSILRRLLFAFDPETAHQIAKNILGMANKVPGTGSILESVFSFNSPRLAVNVAGIDFPNPLGLAAGFDKNGDMYPWLSRMGFGFIEIGTITGTGQPGNPRPRIFRYPEQEALINRMGFNNPGCAEVKNIISQQPRPVPRGINAGKTKLVSLEEADQDYIKTFSMLADYGDYFVINISSPNTPGLRDLQNLNQFSALIQSVRKGVDFGGKPLFVKFSPDLSEKDLLDLLDVCLDNKVGGVILTNTTLEKTSIRGKTPEEGGLSGRPLGEKSDMFVRTAWQKLQGRIPVIGVGGINSGESALRKISYGASLIQIYTGYIYGGPFLPKSILNYLDNFMEKNGIGNISEITGNRL